MIDWPNLIVGFVIGLAPTLMLWLIDRRRAKRQRVRDTRDSWKGLAKELELLMWKPDTTSATLYSTYIRHPIDRWRSILGPDDFRALEAVENAYQWAEHCARAFRESQTEETEAAVVEAARRRATAIATFANISRGMQSLDYTEVVTREQRQKVRRDYLHNPIKTWRRERHNRRIRQEDARMRSAG